MDARTRFLFGILTWGVILPSVQPLRADEAADQYTVAATHYAAQRWDLAATEFRTLLDRFPQSPRANEAAYFLGESQVQSGQYRLAAETFGRLLDKHPEPQLSKRALFRRGEALHLAGDAMAAEPVLRSYLEQAASAKPPAATQAIDPSIAHAQCYHGAVLLALDQPQAAQKRFDEALARISGGTLADMCQLGKAQAAERLKQWDEAARGYETLTSAKSPNVAQQARLRLGMLQSRRGQFASAVATLKPLAETASDNALRDDARYWTAMSLQQAGHSQAALELLLPWTEKPGPRCDEARYRAGIALSAAGRSKDAHAMLEKVVAGCPWGDAALAARIQLAIAAGDDALTTNLYSEFDRRYPLIPRMSEVAELVARRSAQTGKHAVAIRLLESRLGDGRKDDEADRRRRYLLAISYVAAGRSESALRQLDLVISSSDREVKARGLQSQGAVLMQLGRHKEAMAAITACLELRPDGPESVACRGNLAICHARTGQLTSAREIDRELQARFPLDPSRPAAMLALAEAAQAAGDRVFAETLWKCVGDSRATVAQRAPALYELARSQLLKNQPAECDATCRRLLELNPAIELVAQTRLLHGAAQEKLGRQGDALLSYQALLKLPLGQGVDAIPAALMGAARMEDARRHRDEAIQLYDRAAAQYPQWADADLALYQAAWLSQSAGNDIEATARFQKLHQKYPQSRFWADATYRLAASALKSKQNDAVRCLVTALCDQETTPPEVLAHALLLDVQRATVEGNWPDAEKSAAELIQRLPESKLVPVAEFWLAEAAYRQQHTDEASRRFNKLAKRDLRGQEAWLALVPLRQGQLAATARDWPTARSMVEKLRRDWPNCEQQQEVDYLCGRCLAADARFDEARAAYARVTGSADRGKTETAAMAQWMIGETYLHQKRYEDAVREYLRVEALYGFPQWQAAALIEAGKCYEALGRRADAASIYRQIIEKYAQTIFCDEARQRLRAESAPEKSAAAPSIPPGRTPSR